MKVGTLVRWRGDSVNLGIVVELRGSFAHIVWSKDPSKNGLYPLEHRRMEILNEGR